MEKNKNDIVKRVLHTASELRVRESEQGESKSRTITGYAILFNSLSVPMPSYYDDEEIREIIAPEAVTKELLDGCDIKMTMFHDRQLILARSNKGSGTLSYGVDDKGVYFEFEAPKTADGDKALELVRRGDIAGCSFAFCTHYNDEKYVSCDVHKDGDKSIITYTVRVITDILDFTLAADPAYPETNCDAERELFKGLRASEVKEEKPSTIQCEQVRLMRGAASQKLNV